MSNISTKKNTCIKEIIFIIFCKRINNKVVKISLQSNDLNYCKRLRNKILERLNMAKKKEEEIVCKVIKVESRIPSQKPKDILFRKAIQSKMQDIEDIQSIKETKDNLSIDKLDTVLQALNPKGTTKDILRNILKNLDEHYDKYIHYRITRAKVSDDSIKNSNAAFRYLKYFISKYGCLKRL